MRKTSLPAQQTLCYKHKWKHLQVPAQCGTSCSPSYSRSVLCAPARPPPLWMTMYTTHLKEASSLDSEPRSQYSMIMCHSKEGMPSYTVSKQSLSLASTCSTSTCFHTCLGWTGLLVLFSELSLLLYPHIASQFPNDDFLVTDMFACHALLRSLPRDIAVLSWNISPDTRAGGGAPEMESRLSTLATCGFEVRTSLEATNRLSCPRSADTALKPYLTLPFLEHHRLLWYDLTLI